ncbi:MAG: hypothetical protein N0C81_03165 [Candidatus Thiodiazotropha lotti]|nr:hypothetical protein [Candidatus Thiodiazotropha lotti]MCG8004616.1 hypothetical protein [Candidatus Thiodiazotropha lotti]MCG8006634.1 hypothetical protein [Candidatus Thiodiazotropha lotti]MCW4188243.1 hypothetical protein [Candidatus Thiodiazotropha lotti]MCW4194216.1 hypothetical protein [Candidatus Thiodiazotropha lotti]
MQSKGRILQDAIELLRRRITEVTFIGCQEVMNYFPMACCKVASMFLARYLVDKEIADPDEIFLVANTSIGQSFHAWLELNNLIVDITIDQFTETKSFVFEIDSTFHKKFKDGMKYKYQDFMLFNDRYERDFEINYSCLIDIQ